ncbi:MAG: hypothetical protein ABI836_13155 [Gemmatimonadota bacterium]
MFRLSLASVFILGATASGASPAVALQATSRPAPLRVQRAEILDRRGFERPMTAYTLFVPAGWRTQGEVEYAALNSCGPSQRINWSATDPDGSSGIQIIPEEKWSTGNFPQNPDQCLHARAGNARQYLEWWVQRNRPGARILDYRPRPDLAEPFKRLTGDQNGVKSWGDAGEILISYQQNGRAIRETISSASFYMLTQMPSVDPSQRIELLQGSSAPGFAMRAPEGALDFKAAEALRQSIRSAPEWQSRMNQVMNERSRIAMESNGQMAETNRRAAADRSAIIANTSREINEIQMGTWQNQNQSMDRTQRESIESIRGVETYNDPHYGGTVQLSNQYQNAWQLRDGSYVLTDDPNFDPARALNMPGTQLKTTP